MIGGVEYNEIISALKHGDKWYAAFREPVQPGSQYHNVRLGSHFEIGNYRDSSPQGRWLLVPLFGQIGELKTGDICVRFYAILESQLTKGVPMGEETIQLTHVRQAPDGVTEVKADKPLEVGGVYDFGVEQIQVNEAIDGLWYRVFRGYGGVVDPNFYQNEGTLIGRENVHPLGLDRRIVREDPPVEPPKSPETAPESESSGAGEGGETNGPA